MQLDAEEGLHQGAPGVPEPGTHAPPSRYPGLRAGTGRGQGHPDPPAGLHRVQCLLRRRPDGGAPPALGGRRQRPRRAHPIPLSAHNILSPAHGLRITVPTQDDAITSVRTTSPRSTSAAAEGRGSSSSTRPCSRTTSGSRRELPPRTALSLHVKIKVRMPGSRFPADRFPLRDDEHPDAIILRRNGNNGDSSVLVESTLGRFLFNEAFPPDFPFHDDAVKKRDLTELASKLVEGYPRAVVAESLDKLKDLGFEFRDPLRSHHLHRRREDAGSQGRAARALRGGGRQGRSQYDAVSSPTTSGARRRSRSGARRPPASVTRCRPRCARTSSTPST